MCAKKKEYIPLTYELEEELCPLGTVAGCSSGVMNSAALSFMQSLFFG